MIDLIITYLPWLLSGSIIIYIYLVGNKKTIGWWICLANQILFTYWTILTKSYGFIPVNVVVAILCIRNIRKWTKEKREKEIADRSKKFKKYNTDWPK